MPLASLFAHKLFGPIASALLVLSAIGNIALGVLHWSDGRTIATLTSENTRLAGDNRTLKSSNGVLTGAVNSCNASVDGLKSAADLAAANAKLGQAAMEATAAAAEASAGRLNNLPPLAPGADRCAAASALITSTLAAEHSK